MKPKWEKADADLVARFDAALPGHPAVVRRKMFGYACCFVNGNFFAGLHSRAVVIRLPGGLSAKFQALKDAAVFDPMGTGKGMKDWFVIPPATADNPARLKALLADALVHVAKLPPKAKNLKAPKRASAAAKPSRARKA